MAEPLTTTSHATRELDRILAGRLVRSVYQPIVEIDSRRVIGYEALARGPEGSPLERPDQLFAAARAAGREVELEWAARSAAVHGALAGGLRRPLSLFVNVEPSLLDAEVPENARGLFAQASDELDVVVELTERALTERPAELLARVDRIRALDWSIALDDIGADRRSLALMPVVAPEVIKLDLRLVQDNPTPSIARIVHAVNAEAERTGALVLAEGIETDAHVEIARALGARYGQGWHFGHPGPLPDPLPAAPAGRLAAPRPVQLAARATPYTLVREHVAPRRGTKALLLEMSRHLERQTMAQGESAVVLATFQDAVHFTAPTERLYRELAASAAFVGALGAALPEEPTAGVRGARLSEAEPLRGEWNVVVVGPHFSAAFVAQDVGDDGPDMERRFDFCLTYDRDRVLAAARALMARIAPRA